MVNKCFAPTCSSGNMSCECKCSVFRAPKDEKHLILWRKAIPRADRILTQSDFVCEKHFKECDIIKEWISDDGSLKVICLTKTLASLAIYHQNSKMDDQIITEFDNKKKVKQELGISGPSDNYYPKFECVKVEESNVEYGNEIKQEAVDSNADCEIYEDLVQDVKVSIKDELEILYNDFDYFEEKSYGALDAESSKESATRRDSVEGSSKTIESFPLIVVTHFDTLHKCAICEKLFVTANFLKQHWLTHSDDKPHKCDSGSETCKQSDDVKKHVLTHSGVKSRKCKLCSKEFKRSDYLKRHMVTHTDEKPHKCNFCSMEFRWSGNLKRHILGHNDEKPHKCERCSKTFKLSDYLNIHMVTHSDEKPHRCERCSKTFKRSCHLNEHMVTHSDEKSNKCKLCSKEFKRSSAVKQHMLSHSGVKSHKCSICSKLFAQSRYLKLHLLTHNDKEATLM